jgi:hypothetical protein
MPKKPKPDTKPESEPKVKPLLADERRAYDGLVLSVGQAVQFWFDHQVEQMGTPRNQEEAAWLEDVQELITALNLADRIISSNEWTLRM